MNTIDPSASNCQQCGTLAMLFFKLAPSGIKRMICLVTLAKQIVINRLHHSFDETVLDNMNRALNLTSTGRPALVLLSHIRSFDQPIKDSVDEALINKLISDAQGSNEITRAASIVMNNLPRWCYYSTPDVMRDDIARCFNSILPNTLSVH